MFEHNTTSKHQNNNCKYKLYASCDQKYNILGKPGFGD